MLSFFKRVFPILLLTAAISLISSGSFAEEIKEISPILFRDRILILAAHPDDEAIGTAGVIQKALKAGAKVKVALFTNGDNNEVSFIFYEKRLTFRRGEIIHMGEVRRKETLGAVSSLGLNKNDVVFLGYPDYGTMEIFSKYWGKAKPFKTLLSRSAKVPYSECLSPGAPYVGESMLKDIEKVILDFKPTKIFVSHPADTNRDHRVLYLLTKVALWDLEEKIGAPQIYPYLIHVEGWPKPGGYHPELELIPPIGFSGSYWMTLPLSDEEVKAKHASLEYYKSQTSFRGSYLFGFARKNELFGDYPSVDLNKAAPGAIRWHDINVPQDSAEKKVTALDYALQEGDLFVKVTSDKEDDKELKITIFLFGYKKGKDFASMPKLRIQIEAYGMSVRDKRSTIDTEDVTLIHKGREMVVKVPLDLMGDPDHILTNVRASYLHVDETAWHVINIEK
jgi:LmbE family N-acetylglucosaminyl deacetylase